MINRFKSLLKTHSSLLILILGAGCFFIANILFKTVLSDINYGIYSLIITYFSLIYIYGILGFEQVFLRYSFIKKNETIHTPKINIVIIIFVSFLTSIVYYSIFNSFYLQNYRNPLLYFASYCIIISMPIFSILRLKGLFTKAQLLANYWKILLLLISIYFLVFKIDSITLLINVLSCLIIVCSIILIMNTVMKFKFHYTSSINKKTILQSFLFFFISITSFSIITFGDRFIIEQKNGLETVGIYFFLSNFLLAPYGILQNYIGFKQLVKYKEGINLKTLFNNIYLSILLGITLGLLLFIIIFFIEEMNVLTFKFFKYKYEITLLIILGITRLYSAVISPAFEVSTNLRMLKSFNAVLIISTISMTIILITLNSLSINTVLFTLILLWFIRTFTQHLLIIKNKSLYNE